MKYRVGARHWLFLGMIAQMPGESMPYAMFVQMAHAFSPGVNVKPTLEVMRQKDLVNYNPETKVVSLTEKGASMQRQQGRPDTPWFARVPNSFIRAASR